MDFQNRHTDYDINPMVLSRWSPRAFSPAPIEEMKLNTVLEAAHWAPSCFNEQPWCFVVAKNQADRDVFMGFMNASNVIWAKEAPVLIAVAAKTTFDQTGKPNRWNGFDTGCAWGMLAMEAQRQGLCAHAMGGFKKDEAKKMLSLPEDYEVYAIVALGKQGDIEKLPQELREREIPSERKALTDVVFEGKYKVL